MFNNVEIDVIAGGGGDGLVSFNREKFHPMGGPDGGDGGHGGNIYLEADEGLDDLSGFRHKRVYKAGIGKTGGKNKMHGADGADLVIKVPVGTAVSRLENGKYIMLEDLVRQGQRVLAVRGGRGGLGNVHFKTPTNQAPRKASRGSKGDAARLLLEYRMPADICILGLANSGKSTLLSRMTAARPRVAEYPFTTVEVVMGRVEIGKTLLTLAEMPAIVDGAANGRGMGNGFLCHCMRATVLLLLLDGNSDGLYRDLGILRSEISRYSDKLASKKQVVVVNKVDIPYVKQSMDEMRQDLAAEKSRVFFISAGEGSGISELREELERILREERVNEDKHESKEIVFRPRPLSRRKVL